MIDGPRHYYLATRPQTQIEPGMMGRGLPPGTVGSVDVSALDERWVFVATAEPIPATWAGGEFAHVGDQLDAVMTPKQVGRWKSLLGMTLPVRRLLDVLAYTCTEGADPSGQRRGTGIVPTHDGRILIHLGGHSIVWERPVRFGGPSDPYWPVLQAELHRMYASAQDASERGTSEHERGTINRLVATWARKYRCEIRDLVPRGRRPVEPGRPQTTVSDAFTDTNGTALSAHTPTGGLGTWYVSSAGYHDIQSNTLRWYNTPPSEHRAVRLEYDLSSDDHYAQCLVPSGNANSFQHPVARFSASALTYYVGRRASQEAKVCDAMYRSVANTWTLLATSSPLTYGVPYTIRITCDGTADLSVSVGGSVTLSYTDSSASKLTGQTRCGLRSITTGTYADDFEAADLAAAATAVPVFMNQYRQRRT